MFHGDALKTFSYCAWDIFKKFDIQETIFIFIIVRPAAHRLV